MRVKNFGSANILNRSFINKSVNKGLKADIEKIISKPGGDSLSISEQGLFKAKLRNLDKAGSYRQISDTQFLKVVSNITTAKLSSLKSNIEDTLEYYSSYMDKIENGELDKNVSFDEYAEAMERDKRSILAGQKDIDRIEDIGLTEQGQTDPKASEKADAETQALKDGIASGTKESTAAAGEDELAYLKKQAFDQLQDRIGNLIKNSARDMAEMFKTAKSESKEILGKIKDMEGMTSGLFREELGFGRFINESDFTAAIKMALGSIDQMIGKITKYSEN